MNWINDLMNDYYAFLKEKTIVTPNSSNWVEISTPFVGLFNDAIDIYAKKEGNKIILSDDGNTMRDLEL